MKRRPSSDALTALVAAIFLVGWLGTLVAMQLHGAR